MIVCLHSYLLGFVREITVFLAALVFPCTILTGNERHSPVQGQCSAGFMEPGSRQNPACRGASPCVLGMK
ncbi:Os01g0387865 [Oryza sativa Japonica Group]|uniref:Uncharacterized protein n=2 Tax=Oryza sativa subsp. japonica TaxID=39947 RepID=A0A8J8XEX3_ORYSJ|nr:hypothetical protein OsJ_01889 [Oryza sativa Japonica Group]KAB8081523.1 hypothetical protein EE612_002797 [Oryza sativa]BAS72265.1 Os01g0387865 [Oryza sativa Japonica Group]